MTADVGRRVLRATVPVLVLLAVWEVVGRFELVANGVAVRMAVLYLLAGGVDDEAAA